MSDRFKNTLSLEERLIESDRIIKLYPDRVPIICEKSLNFKIRIDDQYHIKKKYLVPPDLTVGQLIYAVRKRIKLNSEQAIFMIVNGGIMLSSNAGIGTIYNQFKDKDNFLYLTYCCENTYG
jgi:GABA(A) receptor-associated protein